jgi:hypothetical protein
MEKKPEWESLRRLYADSENLENGSPSSNSVVQLE